MLIDKLTDFPFYSMEVTTDGGNVVKKTPIFGDPAIVITIDTGGTCTHEVHVHVNDIHIYVPFLR